PLLENTLSRDAAKRPAAADELALGLSRFEEMELAELRATLGEWVEWARDPARIEGRVRESFARLQAARALVVVTDQAAEDPPTSRGSRAKGSRIRRTSGELVNDVPFADLIQMIATGDLDGRDEVALLGEPFRPIEDIEELARHLLPSTTTATGVLFGV